MKALILNSGLGSRMGVETKEHPKCMTTIQEGETILGRQLIILKKLGVCDVVITVGKFSDVLIKYCESLNLDLNIHFVKNEVYSVTNYIYSIYCAREFLKDDIILMHGDLVFDEIILEKMLNQKGSCMAVSTTLALPQKDFKAVIHEGKITQIGIEFFDNAVAAQPLYKMNKNDWFQWLQEIIKYCENQQLACYAENAFNDISDKCLLYPYDVQSTLCNEIDTIDDLETIRRRILYNE